MDFLKKNYLNYIHSLSNDIEENIEIIINDAKDWCHCYGLEIRTNDNKGSSDICEIAPFSLFPSPIPKYIFNYGSEIQPAMSKLYFRVSYDINFLLKSLEPVIKNDQFTRNLVDIMKKVNEEGICPDMSLLIQRSDYMYHQDLKQNFLLKQIEVNNIAASMGALAERASLLHKRILRKLNKSIDNLPQNQPVDTIGRGIYNAWENFGNDKAIILIIVDNENRNVIDQRWVEFQLENNYEFSLRSIRLTLTECYYRLSLSLKKELLIDNGKYTVAVVYYRCGYDLSNYPSNKEWDARLLIERSTAIKCPWIGLQLANTKKIQQKLAEDGVMERYLNDDLESAKKIRKTFAGLWGLEDLDIEKNFVFQDALKNPHKYVLKPQSEGGACNYYGDEITKKLQEFDADERSAHILMEKIIPVITENYLIRAFSTPKLSKVVVELGFFGSYLGNGKTLECKSNFTGGHILRTKLKDVNEGGVSVNAAVIDSPFLV